MNPEEMNGLLRILRLFGITYRKITRLPQLETSTPIQRAFGFHLDESGLEASILPASFLSRVKSSTPVMRINDRSEIVVNARQLGIQIAAHLDGRLVSVLSNHAVACLGAKSFGHLCMSYLDERQLECECHRHHVKRGDVPAFYNQQLQLHLRQILVLSQGEPHDWMERRKQRKYVIIICLLAFLLRRPAANTCVVYSKYCFHCTRPLGTWPVSPVESRAYQMESSSYASGCKTASGTSTSRIHQLCSKHS